jgi:hypothetical protein
LGSVALGSVLYDAENTIEQVYFPHSGIVSLVVGLKTGQFVDPGMLGRNGVIGPSAAVDGQLALNRAIIQGTVRGPQLKWPG